MEMKIKRLKLEDIKEDFLNGFNRDQNITKCWRFEDGEWVIKDIAFKEHWDNSRKIEKTREIRDELKNGATLIAVYDKNRLVGLATVGSEKFGSKSQYVQLIKLYVNKDDRGKGIGSKIFEEIIKAAKETGAEKLYISASSAIETTAFYLAMGCTDTEEINEKLYELEPCDRHLEYKLI